jgi:2-iminobutanoate/2-iminopropanoate deaminase
MKKKSTARPDHTSAGMKSRRAALAAAFGLGGASLLHAQGDDKWSPKKKVVGLKPGQTPPPGALLSGCIRSGHLLFTSGIGGWYPDRRKEPGDAAVQMRSALATMKEHLEAAGSSMDNVLKINVAIVDPEKNWDLMNQGYREFFPNDPPVRSFSGSTGFRRKGVLLQVDCIAYVD